ncbi:MAG: response regulator [Denitratisoma sp.]|nr:response regulator [Denitratisoma sp.]
MTHALIVDDRPENRYLLRAVLKGHGFETAEAENGAAALALAQQRTPDVIISDLLMPEMDGYALLRAWKADADLARIPFIVYTATYTDAKDEQLALDLGADAFILKPTEPSVFMRRLQEVLAQARTGTLPPGRPAPDEADSLKLYNEVLVGKLEEKSVQLEQRVAELAASETLIIRLSRLYAALSETNQAIVHLADRQALFEAVCRIAVTRGGLDLAWIGLLDARSGEIVPAARYGDCERLFASLRPFGIRGPRRAPAEYAVGEDRVHLCNDLEAAPEHAAIRGVLREAGLRAAAAVPLRLDGHAVGSLTLYSSERNFFDDRLMALVTEMAADLSFALHNYEREALRREAEAELQRANAELEQRVEARTAELAAANRELEAFAYSASHDLRAPLRSIEGFARILLEDHAARLDEEGREHLDRICHAARGMNALIDDLLALSMAGRQELLPAEVDVSALAADILGELLRVAPGHAVSTRVAAGCTAMGDPRLLRVLLQNLLGNAVKYTGRQAAAHIEFGCTETGGDRVFHVRDDGAGFDPQHAKRLFEPFQRFHRAEDFEGTGIGLATAARIVARHGGRIWAEAAPGKGAAFFFTLPPPAAGI